MKKEIIINEDISCCLFQQENLQEEILNEVEKNNDLTKSLDIITYNFNFQDRREQSFYKKLINLANLGINVRLLYSKKTESSFQAAKDIEEEFYKMIPIFFLEKNHSKIIFNDDITFLGSANFSLGSNSNFEVGTIIKDREVIKKIKKEFIDTLFMEANLENESIYFPWLIMFRKQYLSVLEFLKLINEGKIDEVIDRSTFFLHNNISKKELIYFGMKEFEFNKNWISMLYSLSRTIEDKETFKKDIMLLNEYMLEFGEKIKTKINEIGLYKINKDLSSLI